MFTPKVTFKLKSEEGVETGHMSMQGGVFQGEKFQKEGWLACAIQRPLRRSLCLEHYEQSAVAENDQWT